MTHQDRKKAVISYFNRIARPGEYFAGDRITIKAKRSEHKIVSCLLAKEENLSDKRALDIGCGIGGYFDILSRKGFTIVGLDIAENMIKECRSKYAERDSIELILAGIEYLPFQPNCLSQEG